MIFFNKIRFCLQLLSIIAIVSVISSCKKDGRTSWDTEMLVPIATTNLSLQNLVRDSSSLQTNPDNSLTLAYKTSLYSFNLADKAVNIPDTSIGQKFTLDSLALANQGIRVRKSLGELAVNMQSSADLGTRLVGQIIINNNGSTTPVPPIDNIDPGTYYFNNDQFFDSAEFVSGYMGVWIKNHFPIPIDAGAVCVFKNTRDNGTLSTNVLPKINAKDSFYFRIELAGKRVKSELDFSITNVHSAGSPVTPVLIDTSDFIEVELFMTAMHVSEAWAKFPTQNIVDQTEQVTQVIGDRKLTFVNVKQGQLHIFITSTVQEKLYLEYTMIGAYDKMGQPLIQRSYLPPAPPGGSVTIDSLIDISQYSINLTGVDGTRFNTYSQRVIARIDSSGITRHVTLTDGINVKYTISEVAPSYVKGYIGRDTITTAGTSPFSFLDMFKSGTLDLESVKMELEVDNGLGVDGQVKLNRLTALSPNHAPVNLTGQVFNSPFLVNRAQDFPLRPAISKFSFNNTNSNIKDLLSILPNQLQYDVEVKTNLAGNNQQYRDFAYLESGLKINLNAEVPLSLLASHLMLVDTIGFDISQSNTNVAGITDGVINLITQNKYPIEPLLTMVVYDEAWVPVDTLLLNTKVEAGDLDNTCRVQVPKRTKVPLYVNEGRMTNLKRGRNAIITADFSTTSNNTLCNGKHLKIYSDYGLDITFTARFNYQVNAKF